MKEYFEYVYENYLQRISINAEIIVYIMFFIAFSVGLMNFMPEIFVPLFGRVFETTVVILIAIAIIVFIGFVGLFAYKSYDDYRNEKYDHSPFDEDDE